MAVAVDGPYDIFNPPKRTWGNLLGFIVWDKNGDYPPDVAEATTTAGSLFLSGPGLDFAGRNYGFGYSASSGEGDYPMITGPTTLNQDYLSFFIGKTLTPNQTGPYPGYAMTLSADLFTTGFQMGDTTSYPTGFNTGIESIEGLTDQT